MKLFDNELTLLSPDAVTAKAVADYYVRNKDFLKAFEPTRDESFFTEEYQKSVLDKEIADGLQKSSSRFYLTLSDSPDKIIGIIGLNEIIYGAFYSAFLGYKSDAEHLNRGYMTRAVATITEYAFTAIGLHRIEANVMPRNKASLRVLEKCGYQNEGLARHYLNINGIWEDHIHMVKINE